jgi:hypothetical protein
MIFSNEMNYPSYADQQRLMQRSPMGYSHNPLPSGAEVNSIAIGSQEYPP